MKIKARMKRFLSSLLVLSSALSGSASSATALCTDYKTGFGSVCITTQTGETMTVTLSDDMTTRFTESHIIFADAANEVTLPLARLRSYEFVEAVVPEGIDEVPVVQAGHGAIFTADGRQIGSLSGAPAGLYIVKHGKSSIKIYHK